MSSSFGFNPIINDSTTFTYDYVSTFSPFSPFSAFFAFQFFQSNWSYFRNTTRLFL